MNEMERQNKDTIYTFALITWVVISVLTGTYLRVRSEDQSMSVDWLIMARLAACLWGGFFGIMLLKKRRSFGPGMWIVLAFLFAALISVTFSQYKELVFGYWLLLAGSAVLTAGIVYHAESVQDLIKVENIWFVLMVSLLVKDALTAMMAPQMQTDYGVGGPQRIGMGVTHANALGFGAAISFWLSFKNEFKRKWLLMTLRFLLLTIILLAWSRTAIISLIVAGFARFWFKQGMLDERHHLFRLAVLLALLGSVVLFALSLAFDSAVVKEVLQEFNRGQDLETVTTLTGRTEIWPVVIHKIFAGPQYFLIGHGYGVSRLVINEGYEVPAFYASNAHNTFMEILLTMGLFGSIFFVGMFLYGLQWLFRYRSLAAIFSNGFTLRAITTLTIILIHANTESVMGTKIGPVTLLFFFYLLALDRKKELS